MGEAVALPQRTTSERELPLQLLLADDVARMRSLLASWAREAIDGLVVIEAADGAEAIQQALQRRPQVALLDVTMRPLGGIEAALTLRELLPDLRLALQATNSYAHRRQAREHRLPLFDKSEFEHALAWILSQARWRTGVRSEAELLEKRRLVCTGCGYGVFRSEPPERCPMCQAEDAWTHQPTRSSKGLVPG